MRQDVTEQERKDKDKMAEGAKWKPVIEIPLTSRFETEAKKITMKGMLAKDRKQAKFLGVEDLYDKLMDITEEIAQRIHNAGGDRRLHGQGGIGD